MRRVQYRLFITNPFAFIYISLVWNELTLLLHDFQDEVYTVCLMQEYIIQYNVFTQWKVL